MCETIDYFALDSGAPLQSDAYRIGRRTTRSATREEEALEEELEALEAHISFTEHQRRAIADALGDGPPVTLESFFEEAVAPGEYQLFVTSEIHAGLIPAEAAHVAVDEFAAETVASSSEPSSPAPVSVTVVPSTPSAAAMFRAAAAAAASPGSVGPRRRRANNSGSNNAVAPSPTQHQRTTRSSSERTYDSFSVTSDGDDSFEAFDEINIEITDVTGANERYTTVITAVTPVSPAPTPSKRRGTPGSATKRGAPSPVTPMKRNRRTTTNTTSFTLIETKTNYLEDKPSRTGSYAGEEVLRISSVVIEETDVDILN